jgi:hypothetical protein
VLLTEVSLNPSVNREKMTEVRRAGVHCLLPHPPAPPTPLRTKCRSCSRPSTCPPCTWLSR